MKNQIKSFIESYLTLFVNANLNDEEYEYFSENMAKAEKLGFKSPKDYYTLPETQYCIIEYAYPEYKTIAQTGLEKILNSL